MACLIDATLVIPTIKRARVLSRTIESISHQSYQPNQIIVIDATNPFKSRAEFWKRTFTNLKSEIIHIPAVEKGAASQRNQGVALAKDGVVGFCDDDILLEKDCTKNLWHGLLNNPNCGGINAVMTNQSYHEPGIISRTFYNLLSTQKLPTYSGRCFGPAIAFYPNSSNDAPEFIEVDWLNLGYAMYRKEALPNPVFDDHFKGYSLMEDLAMSLQVAKKWKLYTAKTAKIYHDSQPGDDKNDFKIFSEMDLVNRFFIMKYILKRSSITDNCKLLLQQLFSGVASRKIIGKDFWIGKISGLKKLRRI